MSNSWSGFDITVTTTLQKAGGETVEFQLDLEAGPTNSDSLDEIEFVLKKDHVCLEVDHFKLDGSLVKKVGNRRLYQKAYPGQSIAGGSPSVQTHIIFKRNYIGSAQT